MLRTALYTYLFALCLYFILRFTSGDGVWWLSLLNTFAPLLFLPLLAALPVAWFKGWRWCSAFTGLLIGVGLLWFGPVLSLGSKNELVGETLEVITYNMRIDAEGLAPWLQQVDADIVMLQEVPEGLTEAIPTLVEHYPYQLNQPEWSNVILSRYPLSEAEVATDMPMQRTEVNIDGRRVALYNVHFRWPIGEPRFTSLPWFEVNAFSRYDDSVRNQQIETLLGQLRQEPLPYIVAGDFNMSQHAATYGRVAEVMQDAFREAGRGWGNTWPTKLQSGLPIPLLLRLDYIWHSEAFVTQEVRRGPELASDHLPVYAALGLE